MTSLDPLSPRRLLRAHRSDLLAVAALVALVALFFSPALKDGPAFGGFDLDLSLSSLTQGLFHTIHSPYNGDAVSQMVAWNTLDWKMIHNGQFPLWNNYSVLGMPQFFNFESSVLSLPDIVSYAVPLSWAFLTTVMMKMLIAGTGAYLFGRVLKLSSLSSFLAGATFMLSGAFANWLTWPLSDVAAWSGWICGLALLVYRAGAARWPMLLLSFAVAFSILGGFPEANVMFGVAVIVGVIFLGVAMLLRRVRLDLWGSARVILSGLLGVALSAPLWLPGLSVIAASHRTEEGNYVGLPLRTLPLTFSQGLFGLPFASSGPFQLSRWNYYETVSYVGIIAIMLVLVALFYAPRRLVVIALTGALLATLALTYQPGGFHELQRLLDHSGALSEIRFERMRIFTAFFAAMLVGVGFDLVWLKLASQRTKIALVSASAVGALLVLWAIVTTLLDHPTARVLKERLHALWPPAILAVFVVALAVGAYFVRRRSFLRTGLLALGIAQVAFLFFSGVAVPSYSATVYPVTPSVTRLTSRVNGALVGLDGGNASNVRLFSHLGFYPNVNIGYGLRLFAVHDPMVPKAYFASWPDQAAAPERFGVGLFSPDIDTVGLARRYGIAYVLVAPGLVAPKGMRLVTTIKNERLFFVPGASMFSLSSPTAGRVGAVSGNGDGQFRVKVDLRRPTRLVARITDLPGWQVEVDGRRVSPHAFDDIMMSIDLPRGAHVLRFSYWPKRFSEGLALSAAALFAMFVVVFAAPMYHAVLSRRRRGKRRGDRASPDSPASGRELATL